MAAKARRVQWRITPTGRSSRARKPASGLSKWMSAAWRNFIARTLAGFSYRRQPIAVGLGPDDLHSVRQPTAGRRLSGGLDPIARPPDAGAGSRGPPRLRRRPR